MFSFPRSVARRLRLLARKSLAGRPRGPAPPVWVYLDRRGITIAITSEEVTIAMSVPGSTSFKVPVWLPMKGLECVEGTGDDMVHVDAGSQEQVTLNWTDRGLSLSQSFVVPVLKTVERPQWPKSTKLVPPRFLQALHEAGQSTAREANRYALQRVQIRGKVGEVIGTDSYFVYRHEGFQLPFSQDLLVPAVPLFGLEEWTKAKEIRVGRTEKHVAVVADNVTAFLNIDAAGRYPDVASVFPKTPTPATLTVDPQDALFLLDALPTLPGNEGEHRPVTLDLVTGFGGIVRATSPKTKAIVEVRLPRSPVKSGPMRVAVDRRYLARMLALGCRSFQIFTEHRPVIGTGESVTTLFMPVDSDLIVKPSPQARVLTPESPSKTLRSTPVKSSEPINNVAADAEVPDPLVEAEALRNALGEAQHHLGRLMNALRSKKKEQKALNQVWSSLKSLNLGG